MTRRAQFVFWCVVVAVGVVIWVVSEWAVPLR